MDKPENIGSDVETEMVIGSGKRLTIDTIAGFAERLRQALEEATSVVIEFDTDVEMDLTALQVFYSACRTAMDKKKKFTHRGPLPQTLIDLMVETGAERHEYEANDDATHFCWFGGMEKWES